jgi:hypothetical protein
MTKTGYMCKIDYDHELGHACGGTSVYSSLEDLKEHHDCWEECGIVEVKITLKEVILETNLFDKP